MRVRAVVLALVLLVAGGVSSLALAKGKPTTTSSSGTTTTAHGKGHAKLVICHKAGKSGRWVKIKVATKAVEKAHLKHGDVLPDSSGNCPANTLKHPSTTTTATTTSG
jgi:hypothetical protein